MAKPQVLIVDDMDINIEILTEILRDLYDVRAAARGAAAVDMLLHGEIHPKIILLDIRMPEMDGYQVLGIIQSHETLKKIPVIFITAEDEESAGLAAGAVDYINKPFHADIIRLRVANQIKLKTYTDSLEELLLQKTEEITETQGRVLEAVADIIEYRSMESGEHIKRTSTLTMHLLNYLISDTKYAREIIGLDPPLVVKSVAMHDIGKIGIPDNILLKPGRLTSEEFDVIKTHTTIGKDIVESIIAKDDSPYLHYCRDIAYHHHERYDGKGYPTGIGGEDIPLTARILSVVDVYDALTSKRVYKPAYSHEESVGMILEGGGTQFDPIIAQAVGKVSEEFKRIALAHAG
ncbi:MAG: response regulator [Defluviitaleaceae bacterium]|nr:response regulator [Defluviitaleaceae bacterium]